MLTCCWPGCRTGAYVPKGSTKGSFSSKVKYSLHIFPKNEELRTAWIHSVPRNNFVPSKTARVCSRHFTECSFTTERQDTNSSRNRTAQTPYLIRRKLKSNAVPSALSESQSEDGPPLYGLYKAELEKKVLAEKQGLIKSDAINKFEDIQFKLDRSRLPSNVHDVYESDFVTFFAFSSSSKVVPSLSYGIKIYINLKFEIFSYGLSLPKSAVDHICPSDIIHKLSYLYKILDYLKNRIQCQSSSNISIARELLKFTIEEDKHKANDDLSFIAEQLDLSLRHPKGRRYSTKLLEVASVWRLASPVLYDLILESRLIHLPSEVHLNALKRSLKGVKA